MSILLIVQVLQDEIDGHAPHIAQVTEMGNKLVSEGNFASANIQERLGRLKSRWSELLSAAAMRNANLKKSEVCHQVSMQQI